MLLCTMKRSLVDEREPDVLAPCKRVRERPPVLGFKRPGCVDPWLDPAAAIPPKQARLDGTPAAIRADACPQATSQEAAQSYIYSDVLKDLLGRDEKFILDPTRPDPKSMQLVVYHPPSDYMEHSGLDVDGEDSDKMEIF